MNEEEKGERGGTKASCLLSVGPCGSWFGLHFLVKIRWTLSEGLEQRMN